MKEQIRRLTGWSLRARILMLANLTLGLSLAGLCYAMISAKVTVLKSGKQDKFNSMLSFIETSSAVYLQNFDITALETFAKQAVLDPDIDRVVFFDRDGKVLVDSQDAHTPETAATAGAESTAPRSDEVASPTAMSSANSLVRMIKSGEETVGSIRILTNDQHVVSETKSEVKKVFALAVGLMTVLSLLLLTIVNSITRVLDRTIRKLEESSQNLQNTSGRLLSVGAENAQHTSSQTDAIHEIHTIAVQMNALMRNSAESNAQTVNVIRQTAERSIHGQRSVGSLTSSMGELQNASGKLWSIFDVLKKITEKTSVIDSIVFKTQILSFNASIEAARAGTQGRGFAVVATEVGNLAELTGQVSKEIMTLLSESSATVERIIAETQNRIADSKQHSDATTEAFHAISEGLEKVLLEAQGMLESLREQESGIAKVSSSVNTVNQSAVNVRASAEELRDSASRLSEQAKELTAIIGSLTAYVSGQAVQKA